MQFITISRVDNGNTTWLFSVAYWNSIVGNYKKYLFRKRMSWVNKVSMPKMSVTIKSMETYREACHEIINCR